MGEGMVNLTRLFAGAVIATIFGSTAAWAEPRVFVSAGIDYSSGDYGGDEDTDVIAVPLSARLTMGNWAFRVSVPYLQVDGPADVADTLDGGDGGSTGTVVREGTERGFGDTTVSVEHTFRDIGGSHVYVELAARVRVPTGDEDKGLGVGETDYIAATEVGFSSSDGGAYISAGYRFLGNDDHPDRQDGAQAGVGAWLPAGDNTRIGAFATWREASIDGNDDPATAGAFVSHRLSERLRVSVSAAAGLSDASADYSTGVRLTWRM